jgi:hypothetical protein
VEKGKPARLRTFRLISKLSILVINVLPPNVWCLTVLSATMSAVVGEPGMRQAAFAAA